MSSLVSIIIPSFNSASKICGCIKSILQQSYSNYEILVVDGVSSDTTRQIVEEMSASSDKINFISEKDNGIYDAMNKGIKRAKGDWLYFLGSDDRLHNAGVLENIFDKNDLQQFDVVYGNVYNTYLKKVCDGEFDSEKACVDTMCHQSIFYRKELFEKFGYYDQEMKVYAHVWLDKILFADPTVKWKYIDLVVADYDGYGYSQTNMDVKYWKNAEQLLNKSFGGKVSKKTIYTGLLPIPKWQFSFHSLVTAVKIAAYTGSGRSLSHWFNHPYQYIRLAMQKFTKPKGKPGVV